MGMDLELLVSRYETGQISRRELLSTLTAMLLPASAIERDKPEIGLAKALNHVTLMVPDVERSRKFYQELFGMPVLTPQKPGVNLSTGTGFIGLYPADQGDRARIDHFCLGLDQFDAEATHKKLTVRGLESNIRLRGDTKELYFVDPDGILVQLQDVRYRGGVGPIGDRNPK